MGDEQLQLNRQVLSDTAMDKAKDCVETQAVARLRGYLDEWSIGVTDARLRAWNDACISHRFGVRTTNWPRIREFEEEVGWTYDQLRTAVLIHYAEQYGDSAWVVSTNAAMTQVQRPTLGSKRVYMGRPLSRPHIKGQYRRLCPSGPTKEWRGGVICRGSAQS